MKTPSNVISLDKYRLTKITFEERSYQQALERLQWEQLLRRKMFYAVISVVAILVFIIVFLALRLAAV